MYGGVSILVYGKIVGPRRKCVRLTNESNEIFNVYQQKSHMASE